MVKSIDIRRPTKSPLAIIGQKQLMVSASLDSTWRPGVVRVGAEPACAADSTP